MPKIMHILYYGFKAQKHHLKIKKQFDKNGCICVTTSGVIKTTRQLTHQ